MKWLLFLLLMTPAQAIVNGFKVPNNSGLAKAVVHIISNKGQHCSGTLIAQDMILTAAHCIFKKQKQYIFLHDERRKRIIIPFKAYKIYPDFVPFKKGDKSLPIDLAVVILKTPAPPQFKPIAVIGGASTGHHLTLAGRGITKGDSRLISGELYSLALPVNFTTNFKHFIFSGNESGACGGDSGGPALLGGGIAGVLILSGGENGKPCGKITSAVSLDLFIPWINKSMNELRTVKIK